MQATPTQHTQRARVARTQPCSTRRIPTHVDEARIVSRMLVADHDCFTDHLYDKGFEPLESSKPACTATDAYSANEIWKLEFEYEQNEDLGTPSFGSAQAHADVY